MYIYMYVYTYIYNIYVYIHTHTQIHIRPRPAVCGSATTLQTHAPQWRRVSRATATPANVEILKSQQYLHSTC